MPSTDPFLASLRNFQQVLSQGSQGRETKWADDVYAALGELTKSLQTDIGQTKKSQDLVNDINPDLQAAPTVQRQAQQTRDWRIQLAEEAHVLRSDLRRVNPDVDFEAFRTRAQKLLNDVEDSRHKEIGFLLDATTSDLGSGE